MFRTVATAIRVGAAAVDLSIQFAFGFIVAFVGLTLALPVLNSFVPLPVA
jgi:hypothetical protein